VSLLNRDWPLRLHPGVVVAYLGVPIFLHLLMSRRQELLA
jgi:hypothetical protein